MKQSPKDRISGKDFNRKLRFIDATIASKEVVVISEKRALAMLRAKKSAVLHNQSTDGRSKTMDSYKNHTIKYNNKIDGIFTKQSLRRTSTVS